MKKKSLYIVDVFLMLFVAGFAFAMTNTSPKHGLNVAEFY